MKANRRFPVRNICGAWKSNLHSPPVQVFHDGRNFCLAIVYNPDTVIANKIEQTGRGLSVDLFGEILLGYDEEKDCYTSLRKGNMSGRTSCDALLPLPLKNPITNN